MSPMSLGCKCAPTPVPESFRFVTKRGVQRFCQECGAFEPGAWTFVCVEAFNEQRNLK